MNSDTTLLTPQFLHKKLNIFTKINLLILLILSACSAAGAAPVSSQADDIPTETFTARAIETEVPPATPALTAAEALVYPFYLPHAIELENVSQTINGVTVQIARAYVDEGRVAIQYTVSGLDWPDGSSLDNTQQVQISSAALAGKFGGFSGAGGGNLTVAEQGVITASSDQLLLDGSLDAEKHPEINLNVEIPVEGPEKVGMFKLNFTAPVANGIKLDNIEQTITAHNVAMTLKSLFLNPSHAEAVLCFQMPSAVDWGLTASTITLGDREYPFTGGGLASGKNDIGSAVTSPERCNEVGFDITHDYTAAASVTLTVPKLVASINEVVTEDTVNKANQRLADKGIVFNYENINHGGNIAILARPDGMPDEEIYPLIWDALAEQYEGPWVFKLDIPK